MVDCGEDWLGKFEKFRPDAIFITHAHPDHASGLRNGSPYPVYASRVSWKLMEKFPIKKKRTIAHRRPVKVPGITIESFPVIHSLRAPASGYRITAGKASVFYVPDVVYIPQRRAALSGIDLYIGDGAAVERSLVRKKGGRLFGHVPLRTQVSWCCKEKVPRAIFTHCGSRIVKGDERTLRALIGTYAKAHNVKLQIAYDGMKITLR